MPENNWELKLYEKLGVKKFRDLTFKVRELVFNILFLNGDQDQKEELLMGASNYKLGHGHGLEDLRNFKKELLFNSACHLTGLLFSLVGFFLPIIFFKFNFPFEEEKTLLIGTSIISFNSVILSSYCLILQRYNHLRIDKVLRKGLMFEEKKRNLLAKELKNEELLMTKEKINLEKEEQYIFLDTLSLMELKQIKAILIFLKKILEDDDKKDLDLEWYFWQEKKKILHK